MEYVTPAQAREGGGAGASAANSPLWVPAFRACEEPWETHSPRLQERVGVRGALVAERVGCATRENLRAPSSVACGPSPCHFAGRGHSVRGQFFHKLESGVQGPEGFTCSAGSRLSRDDGSWMRRAGVYPKLNGPNLLPCRWAFDEAMLLQACRRNGRRERVETLCQIKL